MNTTTQMRYFTDDAPRGQAQPFMEFIWAVNKIAPGEFGSPLKNADSDGNYAEVYANFIVRFPTDTTETIEAITPRGVELMNQIPE